MHRPSARLFLRQPIRSITFFATILCFAAKPISRTTRALVIPPLLIIYRVYEDDRSVRILAVEEPPPSEQGEE